MTRATSTNGEAVDLPSVLEELRFFLEASLGQGIELITRIDKDVRLVRFDEASLALILLNLALNAKDALNGQGRVEIHVINAGSMVNLHFSDSGPPISPLVRNRLFTPFFTTKEPGKGVGLGLFTARQLAMSLGGQLSLGAGNRAAFDLQLPRLETFNLERSPRERIQPPLS